MQKINTHTHTTFSLDGCSTLSEVLSTAFEKGFSYIAITDHVEFDHEDSIEDTISYYKKYKDELEKYKQKYNDKMYIACGAEIGYYKSQISNIENILNKIQFEYVINSVHNFEKSKDFYYGDYPFEKAVPLYLDTVIESLHAPFHYDTIGHLGFIVRYAKEKKACIRYQNYKKYFDTIFDYIIRNEIILEINSKVENKTHIKCIPDLDLLQAYVEKGGKLVTFGSDAHTKENIDYNYDNIVQILKQIGLNEFAIKKQNQLILIKQF